MTTGGATVVAARGKNPGGTVGAGRGATGGSKPGGISDDGRRGRGLDHERRCCDLEGAQQQPRPLEGSMFGHR
jgi:hypothetical protein